MANSDIDQSNIFIREVDEEHRRGQFVEAWRRYGGLIIGGISLLLIGAGCLFLWQNYRDKQINQQADTYTKAAVAFDQGNDEEGRKTLEQLQRNGSIGYRTLARLDLAALSLKAGKNEEAIKQYQAVAADTAVAKPFRDYASLRSIMIGYENLKPTDAIAALTPLAQENTAWFGTAGELLATAYLRNNEPTKALPLFEALSASNDVPETIRLRATEMKRLLGSRDVGGKLPNGAAK